MLYNRMSKHIGKQLAALTLKPQYVQTLNKSLNFLMRTNENKDKEVTW